MPVLLTPTAYARHRGCDEKAVRKAIAAERISTIPTPEGPRIDPVVADIQWAANTRARADSGKPPQAPAGEPAPSAAPSVSPEAPAAAKPDRGEYFVDRGRRERVEADLAELELMQKRGEVYLKVEVDALLERVLGRLRPSLLQLPGRLAPILAAESDAAVVMTTLDREVRAVLASTAGGG